MTARSGKRLGQQWRPRACVQGAHSILRWFRRATPAGMHLRARAWHGRNGKQQQNIRFRAHVLGKQNDKNPKSTSAACIMENLAQEDQDAYACQHRMSGGQSASSADTHEAFKPHVTDFAMSMCQVGLRVGRRGGHALCVVGCRAAPAAHHVPRVARHIARVAEVRRAGEHQVRSCVGQAAPVRGVKSRPEHCKEVFWWMITT